MILPYSLEISYKYLQITAVVFLSDLQCKQNPITDNSLMDKREIFEQGKKCYNWTHYF